jgi:hypothetical protein
VQITTDIHFKDEKYNQAFGTLNGTKYERKCPKTFFEVLFLPSLRVKPAMTLTTGKKSPANFRGCTNLNCLHLQMEDEEKLTITKN